MYFQERVANHLENQTDRVSNLGREYEVPNVESRNYNFRIPEFPKLSVKDAGIGIGGYTALDTIVDLFVNYLTKGV
jgi:hypothetical protein